MPTLLGSLQKAADNRLHQSTGLNIVQPNHVLLSLKALCSGVLEINDTDFELLESHLNECMTACESSKQKVLVN